ncbi:hypothetical protein B23_3729 [Geobacillus thermoleovorans B23]|nr:hypothetical protein B23_3729 [Geobacillus thermoleovorans B23]
MNRTPFRIVKLLFDSDVYTVIAILSVCLASLA